MSTIKRRHFLQLAGSTLTTLGLSQIHPWAQADRVATVLAQGRPGRKLALLVGINSYETVSSLQGCLTDVELQQELLVHRFGFNPSDILTVSDTSSLKPTRQNILQAFETHLIQQAQPGDVVVFHFSGHGSLVFDPNPLPGQTQSGKGINGTMVPFDRTTNQPNQVRDITGRSLFLLMRSLRTENVTVVLDSCHSGGGTRGNLTMRAVPSRSDSDDLALPNQEELEYQKRWLAELKLSAAQFNTLRRQGIAKGVAIGSAHYDQLAADACFDGFYAGAFTYLLTRYLWQQSLDQSLGSIQVNLARSTRDVANTANLAQEPIFFGNPDRNLEQPAYFLKPSAPSAEAVIRRVDPATGEIEFWLGGVSSRSLTASAPGAIFSVMDVTGQVIGTLEQSRRKGLQGFGRLQPESPLQVTPGMLLRERLRIVPPDLKLRVGLDPSLGKFQAAFKTALQNLDRLEIVEIGQPLNCLVGRMTKGYQPQVQTPRPELPPLGSIGLFTPSLAPISGSFGKPAESISAAVERLQPRFKSLLAGRILQLISGGGDTSSLKLETAVVPVNGSPQNSRQLRFKPGTDLRIRVRNNENRNLYVAIVTIGSSGKLQVRYPYWDAPEDAALVAPAQELIVPQANDSPFKTRGPAGFFEVLVIASAAPIRDALKALEQIGRSRGVDSRSPTTLQEDEPLAVVQAFVEDVSRGKNPIAFQELPENSRGVDTNNVAVISMMLEVI